VAEKLIVVSGGSRGLGQAIAEHFVARGDTVCSFSRRPTDFVRRLAEDPAVRDRFYFESVEIAEDEAVQAFVRRVLARFGRIDVLINNAAIARDGVLALTSYDDTQLLLDVNLKGALSLTRACVRPMLIARGGRIINISSIIGLRGYAGLAVYAATKAGLDAMTRALARELGPRGITVNSIAPGYLETEMSHGLDEGQRQQIVRRTPLGRLGLPADVIPAIEYLISSGAAFMTGQVLVVDGGITA
jgi:3-oxoacyl-[acyl-carrier protein] reductase